MKVDIKKISDLNPALESDFSALIQAVIKTPNYLDWTTYSEDTSRSFLHSFVFSERSEVYFAYKDETLISAGIISAKEDSAIISLLCIHPDYHGQGLGPTMLNLFEQYAVNNKLRSIRAKISQIERIERFYLNNGFQKNFSFYQKIISLPFA